MDFIERWFGVSPDGGSGLTEVSYLLFFLILIAGLFFRRRIYLFFRGGTKGAGRRG